MYFAEKGGELGDGKIDSSFGLAFGPLLILFWFYSGKFASQKEGPIHFPRLNVPSQIP
jgi:hypothetical protein